VLELSWELEPELGWSGAPPRMMRAGLLGQHRSGGRAGPEGMPAVYMRIAGACSGRRSGTGARRQAGRAPRCSSEAPRRPLLGGLGAPRFSGFQREGGEKEEGGWRGGRRAWGVLDCRIW